MSNRLKNLLAMPEAMKNFREAPKFDPYKNLIPDNRTRSERREDFEKDLATLDKSELKALLDQIEALSTYDDDHENSLWNQKTNIENAITKFIKYIDKFEILNSEERRKLDLKREELKLEVSHDWKEKFRTFFFRILASALFISTLFAIGYIEHEYEWARLPLSKYVSPTPTAPGK